MNSIFKHKKTFSFERLCVWIVLGLFICMHTACRKLAETPIPTDSIAENAVYSNDATAISVLTSIYSTMNSQPIQSGGSQGSISTNAGLAADEFSITTPFATGFLKYYYQNDLGQLVSATLITGGEHWAPFYNFIFKANAAITGLSSSQGNSLTASVRDQLLGEAKFVRAFFYFYLVNEFGDVPLALTTDPQINTTLPRSSKDAVYQQIINDLLDAEEKLSSDYLDINLIKTTERVRPTKWAAKAFLARVYLYTKDYAKAEQKSTEVISNTTQFDLIPILNSVFLKNSREAIWQIQPVDQNLNTKEGQTMVIPATGPLGGSNGNPVSLSKRLLNSFEANDKRKLKGNWVDTVIYTVSSTGLKDTLPYMSKYKVAVATGVTTTGGMSEYFMVLRLAEQYLIRAEARTKLNNISGAQADLNAIRTRAGLPNTSSGDETSLLAAILHERQVELFGEWGHRWFDLKRTGNIDAVMNIVTPLKANGAPWRTYQQLFPMPLEVILGSPSVSQNPGYN